MTTNTVLFLDFDGVLHPKGGVGVDARLSRLPLLAALLAEPAMAHVGVVIASTWREAYSLAKLRGLFPATLQSRILDVTPQLDDVDSDYLRYREIRAWLNRHPQVNRWAALDDAEDEFPPGKRGNAIFTNPSIGLTEEDLLSLRQCLGN